MKSTTRAPRLLLIPSTTPSSVANNVTRQKIIDASVACFNRWGIQKTSLHDIAREAGVTRETVHGLFADRDEVIQAVMLHGARIFGLKLLDHIKKFTSHRERLLEGAFFAYKNMPNEPYLKLINNAELANMVNQQAITSKEGREICRKLFQNILHHDPIYLDDMDEIIEVTIRFLLTLVLVDGTTKRSDKQIREFLKKRLLPVTGVL